MLDFDKSYTDLNNYGCLMQRCNEKNYGCLMQRCDEKIPRPSVYSRNLKTEGEFSSLLKIGGHFQNEEGTYL